jgi:POT family proton-dependent oligopeptide transporter
MSEPTIQTAPPPIPQPLASPQRHPIGLYTLFFTEMWERLSYYGMRALLVLFMVDSVRGGMGMDDKTAASIYGLYTSAVYLAALPGGWLADRFLGAQKAVWYGGIIIAAGHFVLAIPRTEAFFLGLILVVIGTGMLKPNVSAMVGELYPEGGARRDAGFSIFYMGINLGAFIGPFICGTLGEKVNWHYGFGAAGIGMVFGLIQFRYLRGNLGEAGLRPGHAGQASQAQKFVAIGAALALVLIVVLSLARVITFNPIWMAEKTTTVLVGIAIVFFAGVTFFGRLDNVEKKRIGVVVTLCATGALFWAGFEQAGSSFNLFAERYTERQLALAAGHLFIPASWLQSAGQFLIPTSWFQSIGPIFVITLAPVMGALWLNLGRLNLNPSTPLKFGFGLILLGLGFLILAGAAVFVARGQKVLPTWLIMTYLLHTVGELSVSPVGLSSVTKLAPRRFVGQMMGAWFLATSLGNLIAGRIAGEFDPNAVGQMPGRFLQMVILPVGVALVIIALSRPIKKLMGGVT